MSSGQFRTAFCPTQSEAELTMKCPVWCRARERGESGSAALASSGSAGEAQHSAAAEIGGEFSQLQSVRLPTLPDAEHSRATRSLTRTVRSRWPRQRKHTCTRYRSRCRISTGSRRSNSRSSNSTSTTTTRRSAPRSGKRDAYGVAGDAPQSTPANCSRENGRSLHRAHGCRRLLLPPRALRCRRSLCSSALSPKASAP